MLEQALSQAPATPTSIHTLALTVLALVKNDEDEIFTIQLQNDITSARLTYGLLGKAAATAHRLRGAEVHYREFERYMPSLQRASPEDATQVLDGNIMLNCKWQGRLV